MPQHKEKPQQVYTIETPCVSVRRTLQLWNGAFRLERLADVAEAADIDERQAARALLALYKAGEIRMAALQVQQLKERCKYRDR